MAQSSQTVDSLFIELGLELSTLETDLIAADRTVSDNIRRLNRQSELIRLRSEVQISGLDETADAERILQTRIESLNQRLAIQRDRVRLVTAEVQSLTNSQGENADATQRAAIRLERARLALSNLEQELQGLTDAQGESNDAQDESNGLFDELSDLLPEMPTKLQALGMAFGILTAGIGAAAVATQDLLEEFRELQKQSYELNMPVDETKAFLRELKLAGGDIGDLEGFIRGISDAYIKGEYDDPEFIALRKYGEEIVDETGRLKNFKDMTEAVYRAWEQANAAGEGIEFLQMAGGETGIRDAIQYFTRLKEAREDAAEIYDANIDADQLHELDRAFNLVTEQSKELNSAIGNIFVPAAQEAAEIFFDVIHDGTEFLAENKDEIQRWGFVAAETFSTIADKLSELTSYQTPDTGDKNVDNMIDSLQWHASEFNAQALWGDESQWSNILAKLPHDILESLGILDRAAERQQAYAAEVDATSDAVDGLADSLAEETEALEKNDDVLSQYAIQRINEFKDELEDIQIELDFGDDDYNKAWAELDLWRDRELTDKLRVSSEERAAIEELYAAKSAQIEQERADRVEEIRKSVDAEFMSEIDQRIAKIEEEKDAWISAGMDEAEAEELAQRRISKARQDAERELTTAIQSLHQTALEQRLSQIEQEKQAWIDKCNDEVAATQWAEQAKMDAQRDAAMSVLKQQAEEYEAYRSGGYAGLRAYKASELERQGIKSDYLYMTPEQLQQFQQASMVADKSMMPNFMTEQDRAEHYQQMQDWRDWQAQQNANFDSQNYAIIDGVKTGLSEVLNTAPLEVTFGKNNAEEGHAIYLSPDGEGWRREDKSYSYDDKGRMTQEEMHPTSGALPTIAQPSYSEMPQYDTESFAPETSAELSEAVQGVTETLSEIPPALQGVVESFAEMPQAVQTALESLDELPVIVEGITESLTDLTQPQFEQIENPFADLEPAIASVVEYFSNMTDGVQEVTIKLSDLQTAIANLNFNQNESRETRTPVEVNVTVEIQEAHAWDSEHIQELADRVADEVEPAIIGAIGGDSNSY